MVINFQSIFWMPLESINTSWSIYQQTKVCDYSINVCIRKIITVWCEQCSFWYTSSENGKWCNLEYFLLTSKSMQNLRAIVCPGWIPRKKLTKQNKLNNLWERKRRIVRIFKLFWRCLLFTVFFVLPPLINTHTPALNLKSHNRDRLNDIEFIIRRSMLHRRWDENGV